MGEDDALSAEFNFKANEDAGDIVMQHMFFDVKGFTLVELIIVIVIVACIIAAVMPSVFNYMYSAALDSSVQKLYSDLAEAQMYSMSGRQPGGVGSVQFSASGNGYKVYYDLGNLSQAVSCANMSVFKSSVASDNPRVVENTAFENNVLLAADSEIQGNGIIFFNTTGAPYVAGGCGSARNALNNSDNEIVLQYGNTTLKKVIHIEELLGKITVNDDKID